MKIIIKGSPKKIAKLVMQMQAWQENKSNQKVVINIERQNHDPLGRAILQSVERNRHKV